MPKSIELDKTFDPEEETSEEETESSEEEISDIDEKLDSHESAVKMAFEKHAQEWPEELTKFSQSTSDETRKKDINALYTAFRNSQKGTGPTPPKQTLVKVTKLFAHMTEKPDEIDKVTWVTKKCEELIPQKKIKRKNSVTKKSSDIELLSTPVVDISQSIISPNIDDIQIPSPSTSVAESSQQPAKKPRIAFELDTMSRAFHEGRETYDGFKINQHPKMKQTKKSTNDPDEKDITEGYGLDQDTYM